ncbi:MAG: AI-2E family transporter, partial [Oscillospiraceae bacterium]|nr:AI-2E family transporter [Oscillospiraceae bacterium]
MKFKWTDDTASRVVTGSVIAAAAIVFYFLMLNIGGIFDVIKNIFRILSPFIIGFVIAYLLTRPVNFIERVLNRRLFKKAKKQHSINRGIAIVLVIILVMLLLALVMYSIIPQLIESVTTLARNADGYIKSINVLLDKLFTHFNIDASFFDEILGSSQE